MGRKRDRACGFDNLVHKGLYHEVWLDAFEKEVVWLLFGGSNDFKWSFWKCLNGCWEARVNVPQKSHFNFMVLLRLALGGYSRANQGWGDWAGMTSIWTCFIGYMEDVWDIGYGKVAGLSRVWVLRCFRSKMWQMVGLGSKYMNQT